MPTETLTPISADALEEIRQTIVDAILDLAQALPHSSGSERVQLLDHVARRAEVPVRFGRPGDPMGLAERPTVSAPEFYALAALGRGVPRSAGNSWSTPTSGTSGATAAAPCALGESSLSQRGRSRRSGRPR